MKITEQSAQAPVGTTLALLERSLRVMSAVHARLHQSLKAELKLVREMIKEFMPAQYEYDQDLKHDRQKDFGSQIEIIPVSDPNASTQAQRVIVYQAAVNIATQYPQVYDMPRLHRGLVEALHLPNPEKIVPMPDDMQPIDPVSENMAILTGRPVKAFIEQDHEAHLRVHLSALQDPKLQAIVGQSPNAQAIIAAGQAHIQEHVAFQYRRELERKMGVPLPAPDTPLPADTEALIANLAAVASEQLLQDHVAEAKAAMIAQQQQDPVTQLEMNKQRIMEEDSKRKYQTSQQQLQLKAKEMQMKDRQHHEALASQEARSGVQAATTIHATEINANTQQQNATTQAATQQHATAVQADTSLKTAKIQALAQQHAQATQAALDKYKTDKQAETTHIGTAVKAATDVHAQRHSTHQAHLKVAADMEKAKLQSETQLETAAKAAEAAKAKAKTAAKKKPAAKKAAKKTK